MPFIVIPNAALFTDSVIVNTAFERRRPAHTVGIGVRRGAPGWSGSGI